MATFWPPGNVPSSKLPMRRSDHRNAPFFTSEDVLFIAGRIFTQTNPVAFALSVAQSWAGGGSTLRFASVFPSGDQTLTLL
jgi:hypothetical protein